MTAARAGAAPRPADASCATVLLSALRGQRGIVSAELNANSQLLSLRFDPGLTTDQEVGQVADQVATRLAAQRESCRADGGARCATCLGQLGDLPATVAAAETSTDGLVLQLAPDVARSRAVTRTVPARPAGESQAHGGGAADEDEVRPLLIATIFCFVFLAVGFAAAKLGATPWVAIPLYVASYAAGGYFPIQEGFVALVKEKNLDINFLMILGAIGAAFLGRWEEGATLMFLFALSGTLEAFAVGRTRAAIRKLMALAPEDALVRRDGAESRIPVEQVERGDLIIAGPGERIAADGDIVKGSSAVNEAAITGESIPADKGVGDKLFAGTVNGHGVLEFTVTKRAGETTLARIVRVVEEAQAQKASTQRLTDWIDRYYTLIVITVAMLAWLIPPLVGWNTWAGSFYRAMMLLVVASPCALVISTPAAILSAIARAARAGILFKGGRHLEQTALIQVVAFDKTGTLTTGRPSVVEVIAEQGVAEAELIRLAAAAESRSEHPLAAAVLRSAKERGLSYPLPEAFHALAGLGARAVVEGREVHVGSPRLLEAQGVPLSERLQARLQGLFDSGLTTMVVVADGRLLGVLGLADTPRPEARDALAHLKRLGVKRIVMLTGDNRRAAQAVGDAVGVDEVRAELLPEDKLGIIKELERQYGPVAMIGDGVNDAPALAAATVGIAMGGVGSDVAMETADVVLMADELEKVSEAINLARKARFTVLQNLTFAVAVISTLVVAVLLNKLTLPLAVVGHEGSTILVAFNGLRLLVARTRLA